MTMKMRLKIKIRSHRYDINRPRPRHEHKYTKYKMCLNMVMATCIKQHVSSIWSSFHETTLRLRWKEGLLITEKRVFDHLRETSNIGMLKRIYSNVDLRGFE